MRSLKIAGIERWHDLERNMLQINKALTYQIDTCRFRIKGKRPIEGEEVIIEDDNIGRMFAGIIIKTELVRTSFFKILRVWQVDCDDYTELVDQKLVIEAYENKPADEIFLDLAIKYCPDFTTEGVRPNAPIVESTGVEFEYKRPSECFKWLCDYCGWHWRPGYFKDLHFFSADELPSPAPMSLIPGGKFHFGKHSIDKQGLRNKVYVRGGTMLSDPQQVKWKADGEGRIWVLPWPPHEVSLSVGEVPQTVGVENLHDEGHFDYMMSFSEKYIRCSEQTNTPVQGITMTLTARQDIPVVTVVEDFKSQQALAKVQNSDGTYEHIITDDSLVSIAAAETAGIADLREHANPRVKGDFETEYIVSAEIEPILSYTDSKVILDWGQGIEQIGWTGSYYLMLDASAGQSFKATAELAGVKHIQISVLGAGKSFLPPEKIGFHIYNDNSGVPGNTLSSTGFSTVLGVDWPSEEPTWVTVEITLDEPLEEGKHYWIVMITEPIGSPSSYVKFCISISDLYSDGYYASRSSGAGGWSTQSGTDFTFKVKAPVYEQAPVYEYVVKTPAHIWQPGQLVNIKLPDRGVEGEFLIQGVTVVPATSELWTFHIEYGGRLLGIADFLQALVSAQQKKRHIEPAQSVQKFVYSEDKLELKDQLFVVTRQLPYECGDEDAECGMVVM